MQKSDRYKPLDNKGRCTLYGVYLEAKEDMAKKMVALPKGVTNAKEVSYVVFREIIYLYFKLVFKHIIAGGVYPMWDRFGDFSIVKTKCIRYLPKRFAFYKDKNGNLVTKNVSCTNGLDYWYFMFWDAPKCFRHYKVLMNIKYKLEYMEMVDNGFDYLDYSLNKNGRNASSTYIQIMK